MHIRIGDVELAEVSLYPSAEGAKGDRLLAEKVREEAARMSRPAARNAVERDCARRCRGLVGDLGGGTCGPCDGIDCGRCDVGCDVGCEVPDCDLLYECGETCLGGGYGLGTLCPGPIVAAGLRGAAAAWRGQAPRAAAAGNGCELVSDMAAAMGIDARDLSCADFLGLLADCMDGGGPGFSPHIPS